MAEFPLEVCGRAFRAQPARCRLCDFVLPVLSDLGADTESGQLGAPRVCTEGEGISAEDICKGVITVMDPSPLQVDAGINTLQFLFRLAFLKVSLSPPRRWLQEGYAAMQIWGQYVNQCASGARAGPGVALEAQHESPSTQKCQRSQSSCGIVQPPSLNTSVASAQTAPA